MSARYLVRQFNRVINLGNCTSPMRRRLSRMRRRLRAVGSAFYSLGLRKKYHHRKGGPVFITLTYADIDGWGPRHISEFLDRCWKRLGGSRPYLWVAELQQRGAVHYHVVIWLRSGERLPKPDESGLWRHGSSEIQAVRKSAVGYLMKYLSKGVDVTGTSIADAQFPMGLRLFGAGFSGQRQSVRQLSCYSLLPRWVLREVLAMGQRVVDYDPVSRTAAFAGGGHVVWWGFYDWESRDCLLQARFFLPTMSDKRHEVGDEDGCKAS